MSGVDKKPPGVIIVPFASEIIVLSLFHIVWIGGGGKQVGRKLEVRIPFHFWLYFFFF